MIDCEGTPGGAALPGTACNDNNPNTSNDTWSANCVCAGVLADDCGGTPVVLPSPVPPCDDNNPPTGNDTWSANCVCAGQVIDCEGTPGGAALPGTACNDNNPNTGNDTWSANCVCAGRLIDCEGTPGGAALPGTACNDNNPNTSNDTWSANCVCAGVLANDCEGTPGGPAQPGTPCDDNNPNTGNDTWSANCVCAGQLIDCEGTPGGAALPGTACNDNNPNTGNDTWSANCVCAGQVIDCEGTPGGAALPGTACNDNNPNTSNDTWSANCVCAGVLADDCEGTPGGPAQPGTPCDDNNPLTGNDTWSANCVCAGQVIDCLGVPGGAALPGTACNDNNANTTNDIWSANCVCAGTPIGGGCQANELQLVIESDGVSTTLWEVRLQGSNALVANGGQLYPSGIFNESICPPDDCYYLVVTDDNNDGITGGGYILRTMSGKRIIDNADNFSTGSTSQIANNEGFCLPLGIDRLVQSSCDKYDWRNSDYVVVNANPAVSAEFGGANAATSGYQIWFYNPNGGFSFKRFQSHTTANGLVANATRACHFRVNGWVGNQLQNNVLYNVRVRSRVAGVNAEWGTACRFILDPLRAQCPLTQLSDVAGASLSCGATRNWGGGNYIQAKPVTRVNANNVLQSANKYQFRFRLQDETIAVIRTSNNYGLQLNWGINPLQPGLTYLVDVRASFDHGATWCTDFIQPSVDPWGVVCSLTINSNAGFGGGQNMQEEGTTEVAAQLSMYPNPNRGDQLMINLSAIEEGVSTVSIEMHDLFGKRVSASTIAVNDAFLNTTLELNGTIAAGMYQVTITAGERSYSERLVIQP
ncbi:MAG: T9SS type A sorting domain-containing protein [Flavobacteriales bacterium]|nr:T9SS type A sorting domain-containing protein [Flavobacteriales bacterium]